MAINETPIFVPKTRNYNIFVAKIYDYALIDSFRGFRRFIDSPTSYATLVGKRMYRRGRISNRRQHWVLGGLCRYSFNDCLLLHLPFISWRDWWSVFRRVSQQQVWLEDLRGNNCEVRRGGLNDQQLPKTWKVFVSRHCWVFFCPRYRSPGESSCPEGSECVWQRVVWVTFNQSPAIGKGLIKSRQ